MAEGISIGLQQIEVLRQAYDPILLCLAYKTSLCECSIFSVFVSSSLDSKVRSQSFKPATMVNSVCILVFAMASLSFCFGDDDRVGSFSLVDEVSGNDRDINNRMTLTTMTTTTPRSSTTMNVTSTGNMSSSASTTETSEASTSDSSYSTDDTTTEEATSSYPSTTKPPCGQRWQPCQKHEDCCSQWCKTWISRCF